MCKKTARTYSRTHYNKKLFKILVEKQLNADSAFSWLIFDALESCNSSQRQDRFVRKNFTGLKQNLYKSKEKVWKMKDVIAHTMKTEHRVTVSSWNLTLFQL